MAHPPKPIRRREVIVLLDIEESFLTTLEHEGLVASDDRDFYGPAMVEKVRVCHSLHHDLGINLAGLDVVLALLETIHFQRAQVEFVLSHLRANPDRSEQ